MSRGTFSTVYAIADGGVSKLYVFLDTDHLNPIGTIPVYNLSYNGTATTNAFVLELNSGGSTMNFHTMSGGLSGTVSKFNVWEANDKILFVGDFGTSITSYADFRIWDIGNAAWDTYTMRIAGYDGYSPYAIDRDSTDTFEVSIPNAYGGYADDDGYEVIPWTSTLVKWDISLQRWVGYE